MNSAGEVNYEDLIWYLDCENQPANLEIQNEGVILISVLIIFVLDILFFRRVSRWLVSCLQDLSRAAPMKSATNHSWRNWDLPTTTQRKFNKKLIWTQP